MTTASRPVWKLLLFFVWHWKSTLTHTSLFFQNTHHSHAVVPLRGTLNIIYPGLQQLSRHFVLDAIQSKLLLHFNLLLSETEPLLTRMLQLQSVAIFSFSYDITLNKICTEIEAGLTCWGAQRQKQTAGAPDWPPIPPTPTVMDCATHRAQHRKRASEADTYELKYLVGGVSLALRA